MARKAIPTEDKTEMPRKKTTARATKRKAASSYGEKASVRRDLETEKFPADYEDALYAYVNAYLDSIKDDTARYTEKVNAFAEYQEKRSTVPVGGGHAKTRTLKVDFSDDGLVPLMEIADLNYCDLFDTVFASLIKEKRESSGYSVVQSRQMTPDKEELQHICDFLADEEFKQLQGLALEMSPSFWNTPQARKWTPTERAWTIAERKLPARTRGPMLPIELRTPGLEKALCDNHHGTRIPIEDIPAIAEYFHVSFHWLVMGSDKIAATAKKPRTESVLTAYCFMSEAAKKDFLETARFIAEKSISGKEV